MRAFIIGNGPSLNDTPLELLDGEVTYAVNAIHMMYDRTEWRPTNLVIGDLDRAHMSWINDLRYEPWFVDDRVDRFLEIIDSNDCQIHIRGAYQKWSEKLLGIRDNISYFDVCTHHSRGITNTIADKAPKSWHFPQVCRWGGTVTMAIQLAMQAEHKPLYVVGCDLGYEPGTHNHFDDDYYEAIDDDKAFNLNAVIANAHALANSQWEIYNAGVGGTLEAYKRVGLGELFDDELRFYRGPDSHG